MAMQTSLQDEAKDDHVLLWILVWSELIAFGILIFGVKEMMQRYGRLKTPDNNGLFAPHQQHVGFFSSHSFAPLFRLTATPSAVERTRRRFFLNLVRGVAKDHKPAGGADRKSST